MRHYHRSLFLFISAALKHFPPPHAFFSFIRNDCDPDRMGSLDRDAFVRGMTRIDEELRRVQLLGRARTGVRVPPPVPSRPILR